jgi:hypothetical protein
MINNDAPHGLVWQIVYLENELNLANSPGDGGPEHILETLDPNEPVVGDRELRRRIKSREPAALRVDLARITSQLNRVMAFPILAWYTHRSCIIISEVL